MSALCNMHLAFCKKEKEEEGKRWGRRSRRRRSRKRKSRKRKSRRRKSRSRRGKILELEYVGVWQ